MKIFILIFFSMLLMFSTNADINKEVTDLKKEFQQLKELY